MPSSILKAKSSYPPSILKDKSKALEAEAETSTLSLANRSSKGSAHSLTTKVWFDEVLIHYHAMILGDNPAVSQGVPVTLSWRAHESEVVDVDCFEITKKKSKQQRQQATKSKSKSKSSKSSTGSSTSSNTNTGSNSTLVMTPRIPVPDRAAIALQNGATLEDLANITQALEEIRDQRRQSAEVTTWEKLGESSGKLFRKLRLGSSSSSSKSLKNKTPVNPAA